MPPPRPALLVLNQYYAPGQESTAQLLTEFCEALAGDYDVTVVTGTVYHAPKPERTVRNGVTVVRVGSTAFDRSRLALRGLNYLSFVVLALVAGLRHRRPDLVLCLSDPPFVSSIGVVVARRHRVPLARRHPGRLPRDRRGAGRLDNRLIVAVLDRLVRFGLSHATGWSRSASRCASGSWRKVSARMRSRDPELDRHGEPRPARTRERLGARARPGRPFVVMHSGNVGYAQDLQTFLHAATYLRDLDDLELVLIGSGAMGTELAELAKRLGCRTFASCPTSLANASPIRCPAQTSTWSGLPPGWPATWFRAASTGFSQWDGPSSSCGR